MQLSRRAIPGGDEQEQKSGGVCTCGVTEEQKEGRCDETMGTRRVVGMQSEKMQRPEYTKWLWPLF